MWISDYLDRYCRSILDHIVQIENATTEGLDATWYLTTPGCWSKPIQAEFRMLAEDALKGVVPGSKVFADITESEASSEFLADHLQLQHGTWAITCDIGGATCDTALAIVEHLGDVQIFPISGDESVACGVEHVDRDFHKIVCGALTRFQTKWTKQEIFEMIRKLVNSTDWQCVRHAFDGSTNVILSVDRDFGRGEDPTVGVSVDGSTITISR